jgi:hypothetical protein
MTNPITDVHQTLTYHRRTALKWRMLALGIALIVAGVIITAVQSGPFNLHDGFMTVLTFITGISLSLYALLRLLVPGKPTLVISSQGILLHIEWVKDIPIPWRVVQGVDSTDIHVEVRGVPMVYPGVTVVLVSKTFYDQYIHVSSWFLRGPGWDFNFIPKGSVVEVALHHETLPVSADELRTAVETRWRAFAPAAATTRPS